MSNVDPGKLGIGAMVVAVAGAFVLSVFLHAPGLLSVPAADDYAHRAVVSGEYPVERNILEAYTSAKNPTEVSRLIDAGALPWWSSPDLRAVGFRPGASALLALDHALGLSPFGQHIHSLVWWLALLLGFGALARELPGERR